MSQTLRFDPGGHIDCLYTEAIDLHALGRLQVVRATDIRFNNTTQCWDVHNADNGTVMFSHASRDQCLKWEHNNMQPQSLPESQITTNNQPITNP